MLRRFFSHWQNILGLAIVGFYFAMAIAAPQIAPPLDPKNPSEYKSIGRISDPIPHPPTKPVVGNMLSLDSNGRILDWMSWQDAVCLYVRGAVSWTLGDPCLTIHGGTSRLSGEQSCIELHPIVASRGHARPATQDDLNTVVGIINASTQADVGKSDATPFTIGRYWQGIDVKLDTDTRLIFAADGRPAGCALFMEEKPPIPYDVDTWVHPVFAEAGVGEALLRGAGVPVAKSEALYSSESDGSSWMYCRCT